MAFRTTECHSERSEESRQRSFAAPAEFVAGIGLFIKPIPGFVRSTTGHRQPRRRSAVSALEADPSIGFFGDALMRPTGKSHEDQLAEAMLDPPVTLAALGPNAVSYRSKVALAASNGTAPVTTTPEEQNPIYSVDLATIHVAMYDAVASIDGRYKPYAATPATPTAGASMPAAVSAAAYGVLKGLYPDYSSLYADAYTSYMASIPDGDPKTRGLAIGAEVAAATLALRANDGRMVTLPPYAPVTAPGLYSGLAIWCFTYAMKPYALTTVSQFRPAGPPALTSQAYATDFNEVKSIGGTVSSALAQWTAQHYFGKR